MKNGSKEPDWGKFGLDGEKQPLNPAASTKVEPAKPGGDLYGGQVVDDNELFADDQVSFKICQKKISKKISLMLFRIICTWMFHPSILLASTMEFIPNPTHSLKSNQNKIRNCHSRTTSEFI